MTENLYSEEIRSNKTRNLFIVLSVLFLALFAWRVSAVGFKFFPGLFLFLALFFLIYVFNYQTLQIIITEQTLHLKFGLVRWTTDLGNIQSCSLDESPALIKYGGAGVHFAFVNGEYRAFYNFLEFPRVLVRFKKKHGLVLALVFSTRQPEQVLEIIQSHINQL
ncbi:MAG: hypothetical protein HQ574_04285 [Chloroflexi bacterium]|nr:hypothetical protein [Chloroflexota bacterium]